MNNTENDRNKMKANVGEGFRALLEEKFMRTPEKDSGKERTYRFQPGMTETEARAYAPLTLAFLGDAVYELAIRTMLVQRGDMRPSELNRRSSLLAKAHAQASAMNVIEPMLDETESDIYRRGRNAKSHTMAKNATVVDYRRATGFEALIGYLYLSGKQERMMELIRTAVEANGQ